MQPQDRPMFETVVASLAATFGKEPSRALLMGYWMGLEDLGLLAVKTAAAIAMRSCRFMPTVAELRELAGVVRPEDRAVLAWQAAKNALAIHGPYRSVNFDCPVLNATIRNMGGWPAFDERLERDDEVWVRKDFERIYASLLRTGVSPEAASALGGLANMEREPEVCLTGLPALPQLLSPHRPAPLTLTVETAEACKVPSD